MSVHYPSSILGDQHGREHPQISCENDQIHAVLLKARDHICLVCLACHALVRKGEGVDPMLSCSFECVGLGDVRDDDYDVPIDFTPFARVYDGLEVRSPARGQNSYPYPAHIRLPGHPE